MRVHRSPILLACLALLARPASADRPRGPAVGAVAPADSGAPAPPAPVRTAPAGDSLESPPAPLLVPGRPGPVDTTGKSRTRRAREQYLLGRDFERSGSLGAAIAAYRNAVQLDPTIPDANERMGHLFSSRGQVQEAVKCFAAEVRYHPGNVVAARELGLGLARLGDTGRAIAVLESLTRRHPNDGDCWQALGFAYLAAKQPRQAEIALRRAVVLPPARADKHRDLGAVLASRGKEREARQQYERAIALDPRDAATWVNFGNLERRAGQLEPALEAYLRAERSDSTEVLAIQGQIEALKGLDRHEEAGEAYRRWLRLRPGDHAARLEAAQFFESIGRQDIAVEVAREGVREFERSGDAHLILGMTLGAAGNPRAALGELRKAEALFTTAAEKQRARHLIAALRAQAPDSLREMFAADSAEHVQAVRE